jgi:hypothetical protein
MLGLGFGGAHALNQELRGSFREKGTVNTNGGLVTASTASIASGALLTGGGSATAISGITPGTGIATGTTITNALDLRLGASSSLNERGQIDIGDVRIHDFGVDGLPSDASTMPALNFAAERARYGV